MIDIESIIFSELKQILSDRFPGINVSGDPIDVPAVFPSVTIEIIENSVYERSQADTVENHATIVVQSTAYSNLLRGKKTQCKKIIGEIDDYLASKNFTRIMSSGMPNYKDNKVSRMVSRHRAVVSANGIVYRR